MEYMEYVDYFGYNSVVILSFFFLSLVVLILDKITKKKSNWFFSSGRGNMFNPFTYIRMFTHVLGHMDFNHFRNNFLYILLIGPMIEEKYGSYNLIIMILITAFVTALVNMIFKKNTVILGASGITYMLILLSSLVNLENGKIPITLILIFLFYIFGEIKDGINKRGNVSHLSHVVGAICGFMYGFIYFRL